MLVHNGNVIAHDSKWIGSYKTNTPTVLWLSYLNSTTKIDDMYYWNADINRIDDNFKLAMGPVSNGGSTFTTRTLSAVDGTLPSTYIGKKFLSSTAISYTDVYEGTCAANMEFPTKFPVVTVGYWTRNDHSIPSGSYDPDGRRTQTAPCGAVDSYTNDTRVILSTRGLGASYRPFDVGRYPLYSSYEPEPLRRATEYAEDGVYLDASVYAFPRGNGNVWHYNACVFNRIDNTITWYCDGQFIARAYPTTEGWTYRYTGKKQYQKLSRSFLSFFGSPSSSEILELAVYEGEYLEIPNRPFTSYIGIV